MLNKFNSTITLSKKIGVIIPNVDGLEIEFIKKLNVMFSNFFGGSSTMKIEGYYTMNDNSLCKDNNTLVYAYYNEMTEAQENEIVSFIQDMKVALNQECIGIEYNNQFTMVF